MFPMPSLADRPEAKVEPVRLDGLIAEPAVQTRS